MISGYSQLNRYQRQQYIRSVESAINDIIQAKLIEDTYNRDEVTEILTNVRSTVLDELEAELINILQSNLLMLCQLFQQAEKWHLQMNIDFSEIQNKDLLQMVKNIENIPLKPDKPKLSPLSTNVEKTSEVLRLEILSLKNENKQLLEDIKNLQEKVLTSKQESENIIFKCEEKDKLIQELKETIEKCSKSNLLDSGSSVKEQDAEKILEDYDTVLKEQIARELEEMKRKMDAAQSQLTLAEMELEKKFSNTAAYNNMKMIISKKNEQIKELRNRLMNYESLESPENGIID